MKAHSTTVSETGDVDVKRICVLQRSHGFYFPKSIPQERGSLAFQLCVITSLVLFFTDVGTNENRIISVIALYILGIIILIGLQILHRIFLLAEEYKHLQSRYEHSITNLLKDAFYFRVRVYVTCFVMALFITFYFLTNDFFTDFQFSITRIILLMIPTIYLSGIILQLNESPLNDSLWVAQNNGLDYGSGMAYSFFHGYLKLVLPKTGTEEKNLKELMQDYEDQNKIEFPIYKLFVLIPKSLKCFVSLKNEYSPSIDESSSLPEKKLTIAGVQNRSYKNAVYKINSEKTKSKIYVSAEYATPLKTFKDVFDTTGEHTGYYEKHKNDIILQFYITLKKVLERTGLNQFCELIYYEDWYKDQDNQICYYDVGKIILKRLKELKKQREKME
ncbi:hypothetical protein NQ317_007365 [Molorchus minor]|uniref:Stimulator of interferon genes protein n=1 Tax=Molorchus minor TaxID=1323400 RepID=A0ABQ9JCG8_9CUCU|nr:hypothetical protein NQ317_007365 [Molorchus minor]